MAVHRKGFSQQLQVIGERDRYSQLRGLLLHLVQRRIMEFLMLHFKPLLFWGCRPVMRGFAPLMLPRRDAVPDPFPPYC